MPKKDRLEDCILTEYLTEQEQVELLKNWIKQYSLVILTGILLAVAAISGWHYWEQRQYKRETHASAIFDEMVNSSIQHDTEAVIVQANKLKEHYSNTPYGQMALLMLAREAVLQKNYPAAEKNLSTVLEHCKIASIRQIARIRLARLLIEQNKAKDALHLLNTVDDTYFSGLIDEVKGNAYFAMKNTAMARQWYQKALTELPNAEVLRPLLQMKYDNLVIN